MAQNRKLKVSTQVVLFILQPKEKSKIQLNQTMALLGIKVGQP